MWARLLAVFLLAPFVVASPLLASRQDASDRRSTFEQRLAATQVLGELEYHVVEAAPFVLYVQRFLGEPASLAADTRARFVPALEALEADLRARVLEPAGIAKPREELFVPIVLLASAGSYQDFVRVKPTDVIEFRGGHYRHSLRAVIGYQDAKGKKRRMDEQRRPLLRDACRALLAAHAPPEAFPKSPWLVGGLAWHFAERALPRAEGAPGVPLDPYFLGQMHAVLADPARRARWWLPLAPIVDCSGKRDVFEFPGEVARSRGEGKPADRDWTSYWVVLRSEAAMLVAYLHAGADEATRARFPSIAARALQGHVGAKGLAEALGQPDLESTQAGLLAWLDGVFVEGMQKPSIASVVAAAPPAMAKASESAAATPAAASGIDAPFDAAQLEAAPETDADRLADALWQARIGREASAAAALTAWIEAAEDDAAKVRAERELERVLALAAARQAWLERVVGGPRARLPVAGDPKNVSVAAIEDDALVLARPVSGVDRIPLGDIDAGALAANLSRSDFEDCAAPWVAGYAFLLAGDRRWRRAVKDTGREEAIEADADEVTALLPNGRAFAELRALGEAGAPEDLESARAVLDRLEALRADPVGATLVEARAEAIRDLARIAVRLEVQSVGLEGMLSGSVTRLKGGEVRIEYPFDASRELLDFEPHLEPGGFTRRDEGAARVGAGRCSVAGGELVLTGQIEVRHRLELSAPCRLRVRLREPDFDADGGVAADYQTVFALLDDGRWGKTVSCVNRTFLDVRQGTTRFRSGEGAHTFFDNSIVEVEIWVDVDGTAELEVGEASVAKTKADAVESGWTRLMTHAPRPLALLGVTIEGRPTARSIAALEDSVVERRLSELGL